MSVMNALTNAARRSAALALGTLMLLLVPLEAHAVDAKRHYKSPITIDPAPGVRITLERRNDQWLVRSADGKSQKLDDALEEGESEKAAIALVADFNYDGFDDVAVLAGVGYGGAMTTYWLHVWEPRERKFKKFSTILGNPTLEPSRKAVISWERDGPQWTSTEYRIRNGVLSTAVVREQNALRWLNVPLDQLTIYPPDSGKVTDSRIVDADAGGNCADPDDCRTRQNCPPCRHICLIGVSPRS